MRALALLLILFVASCGGANTTEHATAYVQPETPGGRMCSIQCAQARDFCAQSCDLDYRACYNQVQIQAQHDYDTYARDRYATHAPIDMFPSDFEHPQSCNNAKKACLADCEHPYNSCYRTCGGAVTTTSSCQFLCFQ